MLSNIYRQHTERVSLLKQKQGSPLSKRIFCLHSSSIFDLEKKKKDLLISADQFTRVVLNGLNDESVHLSLSLSQI